MRNKIILILFMFFSINVFSDSRPVQKKHKGRQETEKTISFMGFTADSTKNDVISYFKNLGLQYEEITHWTRGGSVDYETYRIEDISYNDCDFNYIDIDIAPKDGALKKYDKLIKIYCVCLTDRDFNKFENFIKENFNFSEKEQVYYGKSRFYSTKEINKYNYKYEGENSGFIYYDEIEVNPARKSISYNFTVEHNYIIPIKETDNYVPFETEEEINSACIENDGRYSSYKTIPSITGDKFMLRYCSFKTVNGEKLLRAYFRNCTTSSPDKELSPQEAFNFLIIDGHPFGKKKETEIKKSDISFSKSQSELSIEEKKELIKK